MPPKILLRSLLMLPLAVPLLVGGGALARRFAGESISGELALNSIVLLGSLLFGGVAYLVTAAVLWVRFGRCQSIASALRLGFTAPLFFIPLQLLAMLLLFLLHPTIEASLVDRLTNGLMLGLWTSVYGLIFGYFYAICAAVIFLVAVRIRLVARFSSVERDHADKNAA